MKTDEFGRSATKPGEEQYEEYYAASLKRHMVQYDYRTLDGRLFACIAFTVDIARAKRDRWLEQLEEIVKNVTSK